MSAQGHVPVMQGSRGSIPAAATRRPAGRSGRAPKHSAGPVPPAARATRTARIGTRRRPVRRAARHRPATCASRSAATSGVLPSAIRPGRAAKISQIEAVLPRLSAPPSTWVADGRRHRTRATPPAQSPGPPHLHQRRAALGELIQPPCRRSTRERARGERAQHVAGRGARGSSASRWFRGARLVPRRAGLARTSCPARRSLARSCAVAGIVGACPTTSTVRARLACRRGSRRRRRCPLRTARRGTRTGAPEPMAVQVCLARLAVEHNTTSIGGRCAASQAPAAAASVVPASVSGRSWSATLPGSRQRRGAAGSACEGRRRLRGRACDVAWRARVGRVRPTLGQRAARRPPHGRPRRRVLPVSHESGELVGVLTDRDIVLRCTADGDRAAPPTWRAICVRRPVVADPDDLLEEALLVMVDRQVRRLRVAPAAGGGVGAREHRDGRRPDLPGRGSARHFAGAGRSDGQ